MMSEENLLASMNLREKHERLDSVFDGMRRPCRQRRVSMSWVERRQDAAISKMPIIGATHSKA